MLWRKHCKILKESEGKTRDVIKANYSVTVPGGERNKACWPEGDKFI